VKNTVRTAATPAPIQQPPAPTTPTTTSATLPAPSPAIQAWAREQGLPVGVRGRLAADIVTAYAIAHGLEVPSVHNEQLSVGG
jgi:hypothetical protein